MISAQASTWIGLGLIVTATVCGGAGALVLRTWRAAIALRMAAAGLVLLVALDLLPHVVGDVLRHGSVQWTCALACAGSCLGAGLFTKSACACGGSPVRLSGLAIALHRTIEGVALVVSSSLGLILALVLHAVVEGVVLGADGLDRASTNRRILLLACVSPAVGAVLFGSTKLPDVATSMMTASVAGSLLATGLRMQLVETRTRNTKAGSSTSWSPGSVVT